MGYHPSHQPTTPVPRVSKKAPWLFALAVVMHLSITSWGIFRPSALASSVACDAKMAKLPEAFQWGWKGIMENGTWKLQGNEKKQTTNKQQLMSCIWIFCDFEVLLSKRKSWVTSQPRPPALTQSATTPLTSEAMVSSDMFWPPRYHMSSPYFTIYEEKAMSMPISIYLGKL